MPSNTSDVNFIPDNVIQTRRLKSKRQSSSKLGIILMLVFVFLGAAIYGYNFYRQNKLDEIEQNITEKKAKIEELKEYGEIAYTLAIRLDAIRGILSDRIYYTEIIEEVQNMTPPSVKIRSYRLAAGNTKVSFDAIAIPNFIPIATFQNEIKNSEKQLFSDTEFRSGTYNNSDNNVSFSMGVTIDFDKVRKPIE